MTDSVIPDHVLAAIHAGHVAQVVIYCDRCGHEHRGDYTGATRDVRIAAARRHLAERHGWNTGNTDLCPSCVRQATVDRGEATA